MTPNKIILVTGGNRGIGFEICRQLAKMGHQVILTARSLEKISLAKSKLAKMGLEVKGEILEIDKVESFTAFAQKIKDVYGHLDVLINNAGVFLKETDHFNTLDKRTLQQTFETNLFGIVLLSQQLIPLLEKSRGGRIVNISSILGALSTMNQNYTAYRLSKAALNAFTLHLAAEYPLIKINACHPGHVQTDMGGANAQRTIEKGAETPVWLSTAAETPTGKFFFDQQMIAW